MEYKYVSGATTANKSFLVAYEPNVFDYRLLAIFVDGRIIPMSMEEILNSIPRGDAQ
jgi:hypothetical protein